MWLLVEHAKTHFKAGNHILSDSSQQKVISYLELSSCSIIIGLLIFYTFGKEKTIDIKYNNTVQIKCHILNGASDIISPSPINDRFVYHQKSEIMPNTSLTKYTRFHLTVFPIL